MGKTMKKIFEKIGKIGIALAILYVVVTAIAVGQVIYDTYNTYTWTNVVAPSVQTAADTSDSFDMSAYIGKVVFVQTITGATGTTITYTSKIQHSANGTTWTAAPTDSAFSNFTATADTLAGNVQYKNYDPRAVKRYLRHISTLSESDSIQVAVLAIGRKRYN